VTVSKYQNSIPQEQKMNSLVTFADQQFETIWTKQPESHQPLASELSAHIVNLARGM
jgi:hypothetical protein